MTIWKDRVEWLADQDGDGEIDYDADGNIPGPYEGGTHFQCNAAGYAPPADYRECRAMEQQFFQNWGPPVFWDIGFGLVGDNQASTIKCECS